MYGLRAAEVQPQITAATACATLLRAPRVVLRIAARQEGAERRQQMSHAPTGETTTATVKPIIRPILVVTALPILMKRIIQEAEAEALLQPATVPRPRFLVLDVTAWATLSSIAR